MISKPIVDSFHLGDLFLGHPPWPGNVYYIVRSLADNYKLFPSDIGLTFHMGDDRLWMKDTQPMNISDEDREFIPQAMQKE